MQWVQPRSIRFKFAAEKAKEAILWMLPDRASLDLHTLLKACYFADRDHLNKYGRPIFGARYRAMKFGPVPLEIYEMLKCEPIWLAELGDDGFPWEIHGYAVSKAANAGQRMDVFSEANVESLEYGITKSRTMTFDARTAATHGKDWQKANLGMMRYEDMLDETPDKAEKVEYLLANAQFMRL